MDLIQLAAAMKAAGAERFYSKKLTPNDDSKHGILFQGNLFTLNIFPRLRLSVGTSESSKKNATGQNFKARLQFSWINVTGNPDPAPKAQLILYPQYPEVRLTGFLQGCASAPSALINAGGEGRVFVFSVANDGRVFGFVAPADSELARQLERDTPLAQIGSVSQLDPESLKIAPNPRNVLIAALRQISGKGWIDSFRLDKEGNRRPCAGTNCGGYTLEAELGIIPNAKAEPDYNGWEIKQHAVSNLEKPASGSAITLMTPEPNGGYYKTQGLAAFLKKYGYADASKADRLNFTGTHRYGERHDRSRLLLSLEGFDAKNGKITDPGRGISLVAEDGESAASWSYLSLMKHWNQKHALAAYVPSVTVETPKRQYKYGHLVRLGEATDFILFLQAISQGKVYYDPGSHIEKTVKGKWKEKKRNQFRIACPSVSLLYKTFSTVNVRT